MLLSVLFLISLEAGQRYYIEALMKESNGGDNLAVAWSGPGISGPTVISGEYLRAYEGPIGDYNDDNVVDDGDTAVVKNGFGNGFNLNDLFKVRNGIVTQGSGPRRVALGGLAEAVVVAEAELIEVIFDEPMMEAAGGAVFVPVVADTEIVASVTEQMILSEAELVGAVVLGEFAEVTGSVSVERVIRDGVVDLFDLIGDEDELLF